MANVNITPVKTQEPNVPVRYEYTELAAGDVAVVPCAFKDEHTQLHILAGGGDVTVTVKAGNAYAGVNDEVFEALANSYSAFTVDSARFKNVTGENVGNMLIEVTAACSLAVIEARI